MAKVFINPGHMIGVDPGAVNTSYNVTEAQICADIGNMVSKYLTAAGVSCIVCQSDNLAGESPNYPNVTAIANDANVDYVISIHCNSHPNVEALGTETWIYPDSEDGLNLANCIQHQIVDSLNMVDRGIKESKGLLILKHSAAPAVLVELGFISNLSDVQKLMHDKDAFARAIARGVTDFLSR